MNALSLRNLTKTYRNGFAALNGIDLDIQQDSLIEIAFLITGGLAH